MFAQARNDLKANDICGTKWVEIYTTLQIDGQLLTSIVVINCLFEGPYISGQEFQKFHLLPFGC